MPKKKPMEGKPEVSQELKGMEIIIDEFGRIRSNTDTDTLNKFLDKRVDDKKFKGVDVERVDKDQ